MRLREMNFHHDMHIVRLPYEGKTFAIFLVIEDETGEVIGHAKSDPWGDEADLRPFISGVHIDVMYRRQGLARSLMEYIDRVCVLQGVTSIAMYVHEKNLPAQALYTSLGYRPAVNDGDETIWVKFLESQTKQEKHSGVDFDGLRKSILND